MQNNEFYHWIFQSEELVAPKPSLQAPKTNIDLQMNGRKSPEAVPEKTEGRGS